MITREELFNLVWSEPMIAVAKRFNVSGSYLARVCSRLNVPRPARGYWAKLAAGKAPPPRVLPEPQAGDEISWDPNGSLPEIARVASATPARRRPSRTQKEIAPSTAQHELIVGAKSLFLAGRESRWSNYLKPSKRLLPEIHVTKAALDAALEFADELFKQLERRGHRVTLASIGEQIHPPSIDTRDKPDKLNHHVDLWSPARSTVVYINGIAIGLVMFELTEATQMRYVNGTYVREKDYIAPKSKWARDTHWTSTQNITCGRFAVLAYTSYYTKEWSRVWKEERVGDFLKHVSKLAREIEGSQEEAATTIRLGKEAAEAEKVRQDQMRRSWQDEQEKQRVQKALTESKLELERVLARHAERKQLEEFLRDIEPQLEALEASARSKIDESIIQARILYQSNRSFDDFLAWISPADRLAPRK